MDNNFTGWSLLLAIFFWFSIFCILNTYSGYPFLVTLLAKFRNIHSLYADHSLSVTLLIAAYNEKFVIEEKIKNCLTLDYHKDQIQILIVTDRSSDQTPKIVRNLPGMGLNYCINQNDAERGDHPHSPRALQCCS